MNKISTGINPDQSDFTPSLRMIQLNVENIPWLLLQSDEVRYLICWKNFGKFPTVACVQQPYPPANEF